MKELVDLYIRVSTLEQAREGYSVEEQTARLTQYCKALDYEVLNIHVDAGYSGASLNRPGIQKVIKDAKEGIISKVIVWKLDRLSRSQKDMLVILEDVFLANDCNFISMMEAFDTSTAFGRAIVGILAAFAQLERENIKERTAMGRAAKIAKGHFWGSHAPLGYDFIPGGNDLKINEYEAAIVRDMYARFLAGDTLKSIANYCADRYGSSTRFWESSTVSRLLSNPVYAGKVRNKDKIYDGLHEPIISDQEFAMAQVILKRNKDIKKKSGYGTSLLCGIVYCGDCGAKMQKKRIARGYDLRRYVCYSVSRTSKFMIRSDHCTNRLHPFTAEQLEDIVKNEVAKLATEDGFLESILKEDLPAKQEDQEELFKERLAEVERQMDRIISLFQIGTLEMADIKDKLEELKEEKKSLERNIESCSPQASLPIDTIKNYANAFKEAMDKGDEDAVKKILHILIDKIIVLNDDINIHWSFCQGDK